MNEFKIRPYPKWQLAVMYYPVSPTRDAAMRNFYNLLRSETELMEQLKEAGYTVHKKYFTPRQVGLIVKVLGEP